MPDDTPFDSAFEQYFKNKKEEYTYKQWFARNRNTDTQIIIADINGQRSGKNGKQKYFFETENIQNQHDTSYGNKNPEVYLFIYQVRIQQYKYCCNKVNNCYFEFFSQGDTD